MSIVVADIVIAIVLIFGLIMGLRNGIIKELAFFVAIILGIIVSKILSPTVAVYIQNFTQWQEDISLLIAYSLLFLAVALLLHLVASLITKLLKKIALGWLNRLLGATFGLLKWGLILSVIVNLLIMLNVQDLIFEGSILYQPIAGILDKVLPFADMLKEINFDNVEEQISNMI